MKTLNIGERQQLYKDAIRARPGVSASDRIADAFGVSNSAKIIEKGLFAFNANFDRMAASATQVLVNCLLRFPPEDEIYFTLRVKTDLPVLRQRLQEMRDAGTSRPRGGGQDEEEEEEGAPVAPAAPSPDGLSYTNNNRNVKGYLARDGKLYLRNKSYWDTMPDDLSTISRPVAVDEVVFSIWPPTISARRSLLAREFLGYLGKLVGREKVREIVVWSDQTTLGAAMRRMPGGIPIDELEAAIAKLGGYYPGGEIRRFHAALNFLPNKHFVILMGLSGTGKTQLALQYARAVHGITSGDDPLLFVCPVRPEWTDPTGLTGYNDYLSSRYVVPPFLEAVLVATAHRESPVFVVLDEMNLARVEYYFSDVLSAMETEHPLQLHSSSVPLEGSTGVDIRAELPLPSNLFIVGTINVDETTNPVSDKVLDRASVIEMSAVNLLGFLADLVEREPVLKNAREACEEKLAEIHGLLMPHGLGFGYRVAEEFVRYHAFAAKHLNAAPEAITDELLVQKVLIKLRGAARQRDMLTGLEKACGNELPLSKEHVVRLINDLDEFGSFQAMR